LNNKDYKVVLVDDDPDDIIIFQDAINEYCPQLELITAKDGTELLDLLRNVYPNLIVLDLHLPKMNGLETLQKVRNFACYDNVPIMIYSTSKTKKVMDECIKNGADYFAVKSGSARDIANLANGICRGIWNKRFSVDH
jgi:CheY-like chemotaxis protein